MSSEAKTTARVEIRIGNLTFSAEGDQEWLSQQLNKVIEAAGPAISVRDTADHDFGGSVVGNENQDKEASLRSQSEFSGSLSGYLKAKSATSNQVTRFLATAGWLFRRGDKGLTTRAVTAALSEHHQKGLTNPADCLNKNCSKGYCEKQKSGGFFITPEGWKALGEEA